MKYIKTYESFKSYPDTEFAEQVADSILLELKNRKYNKEVITIDSFEKEMKDRYPSAFISKGGYPPLFDTIFDIIVNKGDDIGFEFDIVSEDSLSDDEIPYLK